MRYLSLACVNKKLGRFKRGYSKWVKCTNRQNSNLLRQSPTSTILYSIEDLIRVKLEKSYDLRSGYGRKICAVYTYTCRCRLKCNHFRTGNDFTNVEFTNARKDLYYFSRYANIY
jgi:hypothetical protein